MKRNKVLILAVALILSVLLPLSAVTVYAEETGTEAPEFTYKISGGKATVTGYTGTAEEVVIPDTLEGAPVTAIGQSAFRNKTAITKVHIPEGVTTIGSEAFKGCTALTEITIPASVTSMSSNTFQNSVSSVIFAEGMTTIPKNACYGANNLESVTIPSTVTAIGNAAFYKCAALTEVDLPASVTSVGADAFQDCSALKTVSLPESLITLGNDAFYNCTSLTGVTLPGSLTTIGSNAFYKCAALTELTIPATVNSIGSNAFQNSVQSIVFAEGMTTIPKNACYGANNLESVTIPSTVTAIGNAAFYKCAALTEVDLPASVTSVGADAFQDCSALKTVSLPESLITLGNDAFYNCTSLTDVTLPGSLTTIGNSAFYKCAALTELTIPVSVTSISTNAFQNGVQSIIFADGMTAIPKNACYGANNLTAVTIPTSVTSIGGNAFYRCAALETVSVPAGVTEIGSTAFADCSSLKEIVLKEGLVKIGDSAFSGCGSLASVTLPSTLTTIGNSAFYKCAALTELTIPVSVTSISTNAFQNGVQSIIFADGMTAIPKNACYGANKLTSVTIPDSVTSIGNSAFYNCTSLTEVKLPAGVTSVGNAVFQSCSALKSISLPASVTSVGADAFQDCSALKTVSLPESLITLGNDAFYNCTSLTGVTLPGSLTTIGSEAFKGCTALTELTIPATVNSIGSNAFQNSVQSIVFAEGTVAIPRNACYGANNLTAVTIPTSVTSIGNAAFYNCTSLTEVKLPAGVTGLGADTFKSCSALKSISLPEGLTTLGNEVFYGCTSLTGVTLPTTLTAIGSHAFTKCTALTELTIPASVTSIGSNAFQNGVQSIIFADGITAIPKNACYGATKLTSVTIPSSVTSIGSNAFYGCSVLPGVTIPDSVTVIGENAFYGCSVLSGLTLPEGLTTIGSGAFYNCRALTEITVPSTVTTIGRNAFQYSVKSIVFADGIPAIPADACYNANELESVVIPASATSVGNYAFYNCKKLQIFRAESSLTFGKNVFYGVKCSGTLSDSISWTLDLNLGTLYITGSGDMPEMEEAHWKGFASVIKVLSIDPAITSVCDGAFEGCTNLTEVVLPDSVTSIGDNAFRDCQGLTYFEAGSALTNVGRDAFTGCPAMDEVVFTGDAVSLDSTGLTGSDSLKVYYPEHAQGWNESTLAGIPEENRHSWDNSQESRDILLVLDVSGSMAGERIAALRSAASDLVRFGGRRTGNTRFGVVIYDSNAELLSDFSFNFPVLCSQIEGITDGGGTEYLRALNTAEPILAASDARYRTLVFFSDGEPNDSTGPILEKSEFLRNRYYFYTMGLSPSNSGRKLLINMAGGESNYFEAEDVKELIELFGNINTEIEPELTETKITMVSGSTSSDLTTQHTRITADSEKTVSIIVTPFWDENSPGTVRLTQGSKTVLTSADGRFANIQPGKLFKPSELIYAELLDAEGHLVEAKLLTLSIDSNIPIRSDDPDAVEEAMNLDVNGLLENISVGPDKLRGPSITILNKTFYLFELKGKFQLSLGDWNIQLGTDTEKKEIQLLIGFKEIDEDVDLGVDKTKRGDWKKSYAEVRSLYKTLSGSTWDYDSKEAHKNFGKLYNRLKDKKQNLFLNVTGSVAGYIQFSYETGSVKLSEGGIVLSASAGGSLESRIPSFPAAYCTVGLTGTAEGKIALAADPLVWNPNVPLSMKAEVSAKPEVNVGVGLGSKKAKTYLEGGLKGNLEFKTQIGTGILSAPNSTPLAVSIGGGLYLEAKFLVFGDSIEKELFSVQLYPKADTRSIMEMAVDPSEMTLLDRDYLYGIALCSIDDSLYSRAGLYPYSDPRLVALSDGSMLLIWVDDTGEKSDVDRTSLMYSIYDPATESWSDAEILHDGPGYNGSPVVARSGDTVHIVWQRIDSSMAEDVTVDEMFAKTELYYTSYADGSFSEAVCLTDPNADLGVGVYSVGAEDGCVAVAWIENSTGDILQAEGTNSILLRRLDGNGWSEAETVVSTENTLDSVTAAVRNQVCSVAYEEQVGEELVLKLCSQGTVTDLATTVLQAYHCQVSEGKLYYLSEGKLYSCDLASLTCAATGIEGLSNFELLHNGSGTMLTTLVPTGYTCEMAASIAGDDGSWSDLIQITDYDQYIRSYCAYLDENGNIVSAFNLVECDNDNPADPYGSASLIVKEGVALCDLIVGEAWYDSDEVKAGGELTLTVPVINNSLGVMESVTVEVTDEIYDVVLEQTVACDLQPGQQKEITVTMTLPQELTRTNYTVSVTADCEETNTDNNSSEFEVGYADLVLEDAQVSSVDGKMVFTCTVINSGFDTAEDAWVQIHDTASSGEELIRLDVGTLAQGEEQELSWILPERYEGRPIDDSMHAVYAEVFSESVEESLSNNSDRCVFDGCQPFRAVVNRMENELRVTVILENATEQELNTTLYLAVYDESGMMKKVQAAVSSTKVGQLQQVNFIFTGFVPEDTDTMKLFWLDSNGLVPITEAQGIGW